MPRQLKVLLRRAPERAINGLWAAIGRLVDTFTPSECANYFAAEGMIRRDRIPFWWIASR
jgi:hypothetical protein